MVRTQGVVGTDEIKRDLHRSRNYFSAVSGIAQLTLGVIE